ncbi:hypothetical protein Tco_0705394 [Tanacetum coccineum]|uniref:Uncharacterized protein n=1 Tax=Tanacetum coccineum TaxID=301880 RepID=A0ABQ4Y4G7_9ASTR
MSSPNHSTSDIEDAFSSMNILNYTLVSSDYVPASSESSSFNSLKNSKDNMILLVFSPFYNNPCLNEVQAFYAKESPISPPAPITSQTVLTPSPTVLIGNVTTSKPQNLEEATNTSQRITYNNKSITMDYHNSRIEGKKTFQDFAATMGYWNHPCRERCTASTLDLALSRSNDATALWSS